MRRRSSPGLLVGLWTLALALAGLAVAAGLGFRLDQYQTQGGRSVQDAVAVLGPGLRELISQTRTTVDSTVLSHRM